MAILKVARLGNPVLLEKAEPVAAGALGEPETQRLIDDMIQTMREERGVGLAAPQVHRSVRILVMDPGEDRDGDAGGGLRVLVNPVLSFPSDERIRLWEGCLSIPGIRGRTERFARVVADYVDREGKPRRAEFRGLPSAVVQHEIDHLDGILFLKRMPDLGALSFEDELGRHRRDDGDDGDDDEDGEDIDREGSRADAGAIT